jgi:Flp pilus assembly protein TadD
MHRWIVFLALLFASPFATFGALPTLTVQADDGNVALELSAVSVRATIRGHLARTEYELTYRNSLDQEVGGDFNFPLPPDAEVSDLGLWFDGTLRHGVAVERVLARTAYEETIHRRVDPALVEWSAGRGFKLDIYPIPAQGEKKVFLAYDQELTDAGYTLDLRFGRVMEKFELIVDADGRAVRVEGTVPMNGRRELVDGVVQIDREEAETAFAAQSAEDQSWYASGAVDVDASVKEAVPAPHTLILYDVSSSAVQQDASLLRRFLGEFLSRQQAWSTADVVPFHVDLDAPRRIVDAGTPGGARELERTLDSLQPLGATNLLAVVARLTKMANALPPLSRIVLVTDGLTSLGDSRDVAAAFAKLGNLGKPLLVVHATTAADDHLLGNAARATGGWAIDLKRVSTEEAVTSAMRVPDVVSFGAGVVPTRVLVTNRGRVAVAARATEPITRLGDRAVPVRELTGEREVSMVRRAYARAKLRQLLADGAGDMELIAHGRAFTQVTPRTSLLVLEWWTDYERYNIPLPPDVCAAKARAEAERAERERAWRRPLPPPTFVHDGWTLSGRVLESSGAPLPGVTVMLNDGTGVVAVAVTDENGRYVLGAAVQPANPMVTAVLDGFSPATTSITGGTASGAAVDLFLEMAAVAETITVTASAPEIESTMAVSSTVMSSIRAPAAPTTDQLLARIAQEQTVVDSDDPEVLAAVAKQRRELTRAVVDRLRGIGSSNERLRYYLSARSLLGGDKSFHVFAAEVFRERSPELAVRVLTDLAEARTDDAPLLRILGRVLDGWGETELARLLLQRALEISPGEPQTWRELILLDARRGSSASVASWAKRMKAVRTNDWMTDGVYEQTDEAMARWEKAGTAKQRGIDLRVDEGDDLTIELMFDTGWSWVDVHVMEPSGEDVSWDNTLSKAGATFTGGYTFGYGPEIYRIAKAPRGDYRLELHYYADDETNVGKETLAHIVVYARGRSGGVERTEHFMVLKSQEERQVITTVRME